MPRSDPDLSDPSHALRQRLLWINVSISFAVPQITGPGDEFLAPTVLPLRGHSYTADVTAKAAPRTTVPTLLLMQPRTPD